jgi:hypothetical protein
MSETLAQHQPAAQDIVNLLAASLSAAPGLTEAERTSRFQTVVQSVTEFQPAGPAECVLVSLILGHHLAIMDGFRDIACLTLSPAEAARARMVTVAQTKLVLQLARELRITRKESLAQSEAERAEAERAAAGPGQELAGDIGYDTAMAQLMSTYGGTLSMLENTDPLTPAAAEQAMQALSEALSPSPGAVPGDARPVEVNLASAPLTGSRAQRRAMMKRRGLFKRTA